MRGHKQTCQCCICVHKTRRHNEATCQCCICMYKTNRGKNCMSNPQTRAKVSGVNSALWKGGLPNCKICGKQLSTYTGTHCNNCNLTIIQSRNRMGKNNPAWKGGEGWRAGNYIDVRVNGKRYPKHRWIAQQILGRELPPNEDVHHINWNPIDNRPENLYVCFKPEHRKIHKLKLIVKSNLV